MSNQFEDENEDWSNSDESEYQEEEDVKEEVEKEEETLLSCIGGHIDRRIEFLADAPDVWSLIHNVFKLIRHPLAVDHDKDVEMDENDNNN